MNNLKQKFNKKSKQKLKKNKLENYKNLFGKYLLQSIEINCLNSKHIEILKQVIRRQIGKFKPIWIRILANHPITAKKKNSRMGKGKGDLKCYICKIKKGQILCELNGISYLKAKKISEKISKKLPIKTRIII